MKRILRYAKSIVKRTVARAHLWAFRHFSPDMRTNPFYGRTRYHALMYRWLDVRPWHKLTEHQRNWMNERQRFLDLNICYICGTATTDPFLSEVTKDFTADPGKHIADLAWTLHSVLADRRSYNPDSITAEAQMWLEGREAAYSRMNDHD